MAFTPNYLLNEPSDVTLRSWQHAARLFSDDQFRLAPKLAFNFHVSFSLNSAALTDASLVQNYGTEINMLVKSADLPKFTLSTETLNQYNRKKNIQTTHKYEDINIVFHDDNMSLINKLWQNYYAYYYADSNSAIVPGAYNRTATRNFDYIPATYGLDNASTLPFFNSITLYQMARHEYVSYTLYNPIIKTFSHPKVKYADSGVTENNMTLGYEAVSYSSGVVTAGDPVGFGQEHYDQVPSPLVGINGPTSINPSFVSSVNVSGNTTSFLNNLVQTVNGYQNTATNLAANSITGIVSNVTGTATQGVNGLQGVAFPQVSVPSPTVTGTAVNIG